MSNIVLHIKQLMNLICRYLGGVFEIESLVEKLLQQLASKQTVIVSVYDTTNHTHSIPMYGSDVSGDEFYHVSFLNFGDPFRKHEMHCRSEICCSKFLIFFPFQRYAI